MTYRIHVADEKNSYRQRIIATPSDMEFIIGHTAYTYFVGGIEQRETNAAFIAAARNALPALLRLARAAREWEEAQRVYTGLFESSAYEGGMGGAERRLDQAEDELRAALAALDAAREGE